jgi:soluble lytic murein transglycosylase-like protein
MCFCFRLVSGAALAAVCCALALADPPERITTVIRPDARTGKLVRSVIVTPRTVEARRVSAIPVEPRSVGPAASAPAPPANIDEAVEQAAAQHDLPPQLIHSVIQVESNYDPHAVSSKGAQGLMQLMPGTARRFGVSNAFNPVENIQGGAKYLKYLLDLYGGDYPLALAAYNAGEGAVAKYGDVPPYPETQNYLRSVAKRLQAAKPAAAKTAGPQPKPAETKFVGPSHAQEIVQPDGTVRYVLR